ncbi:MAG: methyltransferase, TIGR04325 family [Ignavibacteriales bacterium]|nr:methyltransferase, TIGR04325 family [Ignavibacteriales bacterium]
MSIKKIIKSIIPPIITSSYGEIRNPVSFHGSYESWAEAEQNSTGYDADVIVEKVRDSLLKVKEGKAVHERDSVLFDKIEYSWQLLAGILWIAAQRGNRLNVLDFGGSLGSTYFQNRKFLKEIINLNWNIVEQQKFVEIGKKYFENERLRFWSSISQCSKMVSPDLIILSSVLSYIENPINLFDEIFGTGVEFCIIDRTLITDGKKDIITVQHVEPPIYHAKYPCRIYAKAELLHYLGQKYDLIEEYSNDEGRSIRIPGGVAAYKGFIFRRKK